MGKWETTIRGSDSKGAKHLHFIGRGASSILNLVTEEGMDIVKETLGPKIAKIYHLEMSILNRRIGPAVGATDLRRIIRNLTPLRGKTKWKKWGCISYANAQKRK